MTALAVETYEPFVLRALPLETYIERVPADLRLGTRLGELRELQRVGWDVTALLSPDGKTVVLLGCRGGE